VGKTTLAHIAAKHAGYRPIEINASDDRSPQILKEKVLRAMESTLLATYTKTAYIPINAKSHAELF
jgi:chromosome transmission fidelity protein 18